MGLGALVAITHCALEKETNRQSGGQTKDIIILIINVFECMLPTTPVLVIPKKLLQ